MSRPIYPFVVMILILSGACSSKNPASSSSDTDTSSGSSASTTQIPPLSNFSARFTVNGTEMTIEGRIQTNSPTLFNNALASNPGVNTVILKNVPGTLDADASFAIGRTIHGNSFATVLPAGGFVASGGTDLFLSGATRTIDAPSVTDPAGLIAVHSWEAGTTQGRDLPRSAPQHQPFLDYYSDIGISSDFYWFAVNSAPADSFHVMTDAEITQHGVATTIASKVAGR